MISSLFLFLVVFTYLTGLQKHRDIFAPWRLYIYAHGTVLSVSFLYLHEAMEPLKTITWLVILGSAFAYFAGHIVTNLILQPDKVACAASSPKIKWNVVFFFIVAYFFVYIIAYAFHASRITIPIFSHAEGGTRLKFFGVNYYSMLVLLSLPLGSMLLYSYRKFSVQGWQKKMAFVSFEVLMALSFLFLLNRNSILWLIVLIVAVRHYCVKAFSGKLVFISVFLFAGLLYLAAASRLGHSYEKFFKNKALMEVVAKTFYTYPANNVWNLDYNMHPKPDQFTHPQTYGFEFFSPFFDMVGVSPGMRKGLGWDDLFMRQSTKIKNYNTVMYQYHLWKEFGFAGVILVPFVVGMVFCFLYHKMRIEKSIFLVWIYGQIMFTLLMSFMIPFWYFNMGWFGVLFSIFGYYFLEEKQPQKKIAI